MQHMLPTQCFSFTSETQVEEYKIEILSYVIFSRFCFRLRHIPGHVVLKIPTVFLFT
jgi:hypothetical protein